MISTTFELTKPKPKKPQFPCLRVYRKDIEHKEPYTLIVLFTSKDRGVALSRDPGYPIGIEESWTAYDDAEFWLPCESITLTNQE